MYIQPSQLKPIASIQLSADERKILSWLRSAVWKPQTDVREPIPYKAKVPEFFGGVRLYRVQGGGGSAGAHGALDLFIKKLEYQGVISKQDLYPVATEGSARFLSLKKTDLENLGVGQEDDEE